MSGAWRGGVVAERLFAAPALRVARFWLIHPIDWRERVVVVRHDGVLPGVGDEVWLRAADGRAWWWRRGCPPRHMGELMVVGVDWEPAGARQ